MQACQRTSTALQSKALQNSQARADSVSAGGKATMSDYLHFGRLIGQQPDDVESALKGRAVQVERDSNAEDYINRCT